MKMPLVFAVIACSLAGCSETGDSMRKRTPDYKIEIEDLLAEAARNRLDPATVEAKYKGKVLEVRSGYLVYEPHLSNEGVVSLWLTWLPRDTGYSVHCDMIKSENASLSDYHEGNKTSVKGRLRKVGPGTLGETGMWLDDCVTVP